VEDDLKKKKGLFGKLFGKKRELMLLYENLFHI